MGCEFCNSITSSDQDLPLYNLIQLTLADDVKVLTCRTLWSDEILAKAEEACANEFDMKEVLVVLREEAVERGLV